MDGGVSNGELREVERVFRGAHGRAVSTLVRVFGDITLAEDAVQDAFLVATARWSTHGIPPNPAGWIVSTARNRAIDELRRSARGRELWELATASDTASESSDDSLEGEDMIDDRLRLIFTCCHPALRIEQQVALTLRLLGGLSVEEVARSFLVNQPAMAKRLVRAKYKIKAANIKYQVPRSAELPARLRSVLSVVSLIYNAGADDPERSLLRSEAIALARSLVDLMPDEPEAAGLLALLVLCESRATARRQGDAVVVLRDQDRSAWDQSLIAEGSTIVRSCIRRNQPGPFQLQAAIQAVHCAAKTFDLTDWRQIVDLYDHLLAIMPTAVVTLNRAIATGEVEGPAAALLALDQIASDLENYHLFHAARGTALQRLGRVGEARASFEHAASLAVMEPDRRFLAQKVDELTPNGEQADA